jgi:hypothetical protein
MTALASHFEPFHSFETDPSKLAYLVNATGEKVPVSRMALIHASKSKGGYIVINLYGADVDDDDFLKGEADPDCNEVHISLQWVTKLMMERVAHFAELHFREPMHTIPIPLESACVEALSQCDHPASWVTAFARQLRTPHDPALGEVTREYVDFYENLTNLADFLFVVRLQELLAATLASIVKPDPNRPLGPEGHKLELARLGKVFCIPPEVIDAIEEKPVEMLKEMYPQIYSGSSEALAKEMWKED